MHVVDIDVGVTHRDWPEAFVLEWLPRMRVWMLDRLPAPPIDLRLDDPRDELAWLFGRLRRDDLPELPAWG